MRDRQNIRDIQVNDDVSGVYLVASSSLQQSRNGPYWRIVLKDATGSVEGKIWSPLSGDFHHIPVASFVKVEGRASLFREQVQLTVDAMRFLAAEEEAELDYGLFMPCSPRPPADMMDELEALCRKELIHKPWRKFVKLVLKDEDIRARFLAAPAAKSVHHAYRGGLLEHTLSVCGLCMRMADHYEAELDRQTLLCAAMFHDLGKIWEMSGGLVNDYTDSGRLLGHIVQGLAALEPYLIKSGVEEHLALHFRHLIASHHGQRDFGSPSVPATAEAFVLHYADNVDARVAQLRSMWPPMTREASNSEDRADGTDGAQLEWSPWNNLLERQLARCPQTPQARPQKIKGNTDAVKDSEKRGDDRQCSLL